MYRTTNLLTKIVVVIEITVFDYISTRGTASTCGMSFLNLRECNTTGNLF